MILSPYTNPAYRMPTPNRQSTPPRSPKRKRDDLHVTSAAADDSQAFPGSSPRMQVADKLQDLNIHQTTPARLQQKRPLQRKRLKRNPGLAELATVHSSTSTETPEHAKYDLRDAHEVEETPFCHTRPPALLLQTPSRSEEPVMVSTELLRDPPETAADPQPPASPGSESEVEPAERSLSPLPSREDLTPDQAALTWQEDEITGHEIDVSSGDDGEGINGVGFKPTIAMAYARQQKRKQQVNEWKAREAREARQKRIERRRGGGQPEVSLIVQDTGDGKTKRAVRFA